MFLYFKGFYNKISMIYGKYIFLEGKKWWVVNVNNFNFFYLKVFGFKVLKDIIIYLYIVIIFWIKFVNIFL